KTPLQERLEGYLEQERKNYPELNQYIKNKEWNNQQYDLSLSTSNIHKHTSTEINNPLDQPQKNKQDKEDYMKITLPDKKAYNKWIKKEKEKERNEETREIIIVKNWKYEYPREQFEETEENITDLITKEHDNFELADLKSRIRLTKNECLQHYLSILRIKQLRKTGQLPTKEEIEKLANGKMHQNPLDSKNTFNIRSNKIFQNIWKKKYSMERYIIENEISISEQAEKYKELREKMNNIFDKPLKEGILTTLNQDPLTYTSKLGISAYIQPLARYNKPDEFANISPFNGPLFNQLILMENLEESLYIKIAANKKTQLTKEQYQDWKKQMNLKIEHQHNYSTFHNEEKQFSLKTIMTNQIQKGYDNLHEMLNHDQLKLNFIVIDGAIAVGKTTICH
ncbi:11136_t:CDS:2, partial [Gigaspora margarita]